MYIVYNDAGSIDIYFGREGLISHDLSFFR